MRVQGISRWEAFEALHEAFRGAARAAGGPLDRDFDLAGYRVRLRLAGPALELPLTRALPHLGTTPGPGPVDLTVLAWDSASAGAAVPDPGLEWWAQGRSGAIDGEDDDAVCAHFDRSVPALSVLDTGRDLAVHCLRDARRVPYHEAATPLRFLFTRWMARHGRALVHAGAVGRPDGGVLLVGKNGSGKSTTSLACLHSELRHAGDDYVLLDGRRAPFVHSLYHSAQLHPDQIWRLPHLGPRVSNHDLLDREKAVLYLREGYAAKMIQRFPLRAILMPRVTGLRKTRLLPASPAQGLDAFVPNSVMISPALGRQGLQMMVRVVESLPSYVLELGTDLAEIPAVIASVL